MTLPIRSSPKPVATKVVASDCDDQMRIDDEVVSSAASLLLSGTGQTVSSGHSAPSTWSYNARRQMMAGIYALDTLRPTYKSTLNVDLITLNLCFHGFDSMIEVVEYPGLRRTEFLSRRYSEIVTAAHLGFERQRRWSQYCCLYVLYAIDWMFYGESNPPSGAIIKSYGDHWTVKKATAADSLKVGWLDWCAVLPTREQANAFLTPENVWIPDVDRNGWIDSPHLLMLFFSEIMTAVLLKLLIDTGACRDPLYVDCFDKWDAEWARGGAYFAGLSPLARQHPKLLEQYSIRASGKSDNT